MASSFEAKAGDKIVRVGFSNSYRGTTDDAAILRVTGEKGAAFFKQSFELKIKGDLIPLHDFALFPANLFMVQAVGFEIHGFLSEPVLGNDQNRDFRMSVTEDRNKRGKRLLKQVMPPAVRFIVQHQQRRLFNQRDHAGNICLPLAAAREAQINKWHQPPAEDIGVT